MTLSPNLRKQRLKVLLTKLENDEELLKAYLERADRPTAEALIINQKLIDILLAEKTATAAKRPAGSRSPLFRSALVCPGHRPMEAFEGCFSLGHQQVEENLFGVPRSLGGMDGYAMIDYVLLEAQVCPVCFYASPFRQDFGKPGAKAVERSSEVMAALSASAAKAERIRLGEPFKAAFPKADRGSDVAGAAFALALASARTARAAGETASAYKEAHIRLRLARLLEDAGKREMARAQYAGALEAYQAYHSVELPVELLARTSRQIVALAVHLGQDDLAAKLRSFLFESRTKASRRVDEHDRQATEARRVNPESLPPSLEKAGEEFTQALTAYTKYFAQADEIWQDREQHRFKSEKA